MYAKPRHHHRHHSSSSDASMPDAPRNRNERRQASRSAKRPRTCYICESPKHTARTCPLREKLKAFVKKHLVKEKEKRSKKDGKQKSKDHALTAENDRSDDWTSSSELDNFDEKKLVVLSKEMVSNIPKNK